MAEVAKGTNLDPMRVVFAGTPAVAANTLRVLIDSGHEILAVITRPDAPKGRSSKLLPCETAVVAHEFGIETIKPVSATDAKLAKRLQELNPDLCAVVAYGGLIPQSLLDLPRLGWVNVHYSLLPKYRGAAPVQRAILAGDEITGVSVFQLVSQLDAGPLLLQERVPVNGRDSGELLSALTDVGSAALLTVLRQLEMGEAIPVAQDERAVSYAPKLTPPDGLLDWTKTALELECQIRACNPAPIAWTSFAGERIRILQAELCQEISDLAPAQLVVQKKQVLVGTSVGVLKLITVQPQGRKVMAAADWGRGLRAENLSFDLVGSDK